MRYSDEYINNLKNMNIDEMKKFLGEDEKLSGLITQERFESIKKELVRQYELNNVIMDLISKYGFDCLVIIIEKCLGELKTFTKFATSLSQDNFKYDDTCECCCQLDKDESSNKNE